MMKNLWFNLICVCVCVSDVDRIEIHFWWFIDQKSHHTERFFLISSLFCLVVLEQRRQKVKIFLVLLKSWPNKDFLMRWRTQREWRKNNTQNVFWRWKKVFVASARNGDVIGNSLLLSFGEETFFFVKNRLIFNFIFIFQYQRMFYSAIGKEKNEWNRNKIAHVWLYVKLKF